jgi:putative membrane protein
MPARERILVLAIDIDNDLYRKTKITGPVVGRSDNLRAAERLALADPQDTDANTMFEAVKKYDQLKKSGNTVAIVTVTGAEKEGFVADSEISRQLDIVLDKFKADSCVLVTDGASDNRVLPILKTRVKINSVDILRMKQAEAFENTYFTVLEKLKEPHYARIVFGIPAVLLILFAVSYYLNYGWQLPVALIGVYLVLKGFGLEEALVESFKGFGFSISRMSFVFYIASVIFFIIAIIVGYGTYANALQAHLASDPLSLAAYAIEGFLLLFPISLVLYWIGRIADFEGRRMRYKAINLGMYVGFGILAIVLMYVSAAWLIAQIYFWELLLYSMLVLAGGYGVSKGGTMLRARAISRTRMKNKHVINDIGAYIGKVADIDSKRGIMFVKTSYGSTLKFDIDRITSITDRVIIR